jgi:hypothetical protein
MSAKINLAAAALLIGSASILAVPISARAADADILSQCIAARSDESNRELVRSECMWKHWEQMASWGR